jgi:L-arabinose isomerase
VGTEQTDVTAGYVTMSEDLTYFETGDLIQIYAKISNATYTAYVRNFRLYYDVAIDTTALSATNQDP